MSDEIRNPELIAEFGHLDNRAMILALWAELQRARLYSVRLHADLRLIRENIQSLAKTMTLYADRVMSGEATLTPAPTPKEQQG